jgi:hypothetical protein
MKKDLFEEIRAFFQQRRKRVAENMIPLKKSIKKYGQLVLKYLPRAASRLQQLKLTV